MGETGKCECLSHIEDLVSVDFVPKQWIPSRIRRRPVSGRKWLLKENNNS
jgi:hypothetical protein